MLHRYTEEEIGLMQNHAKKIAQKHTCYVAYVELTYPALVSYLTKIRLYQAALPIVRDQVTCQKYMKDAETLFNTTLENLGQDIPDGLALDCSAEVAEKLTEMVTAAEMAEENQLPSIRAALKRNVIDVIARALAQRAIRIELVSISEAVDEIIIKSDYPGLKSFGFFSQLNEKISKALDSRSVSTSIYWNKSPASDHLNLQLNAEQRSFTSIEANKILQALAPYCVPDSMLYLMRSNMIMGFQAFVSRYNEPQPRQPVDEFDVEVDEMLRVYRSDTSIQSNSESPRSDAEIAEEAGRLAIRKHQGSPDPWSSDDTDTTKRFRASC